MLRIRTRRGHVTQIRSRLRRVVISLQYLAFLHNFTVESSLPRIGANRRRDFFLCMHIRWPFAQRSASEIHEISKKSTSEIVLSSPLQSSRATLKWMLTLSVFTQLYPPFANPIAA